MKSHDVVATQRFSPAGGRERGRTNRSLIDWPAGQELQGQTVRATHHLLDTNLFSDAKLIELFDEHDPDELLVYRMGDDHHKLDDFQYGSRGELTATQLLEAVKAGRLWLNIINMTTNHKVFEELVDDIYDELEVKIRGFRTLHRSANLLISSPNAKVYFHADAPLNMLWHLRGEKRVWVYPADERFAPREWVEKIFTRESDDDLPYHPDFDQYATAYNLQPGEMLTWPQNTPHRVENLSGLNVSLTTEHYTPEAMKKRMTYLSNRYLRQWLGLRATDVTLDGPRAAMKRTLFRVARRLPVFREAHEQDDVSKFSLDK
jgi:Cupin-like domain